MVVLMLWDRDMLWLWDGAQARIHRAFYVAARDATGLRDRRPLDFVKYGPIMIWIT